MQAREEAERLRIEQERRNLGLPPLPPAPRPVPHATSALQRSTAEEELYGGRAKAEGGAARQALTPGATEDDGYLPPGLSESSGDDMEPGEVRGEAKRKSLAGAALGTHLK